MKAGKISETILKRSVLRQLHGKRPEVITEAAVGADYAAVSPGSEEIVVFSVNPVTYTREEIGRYGVYKALNNVVCSGAKPMGVMVSLLVPTAMNEQELCMLEQEIEKACAALGVQVMGGHTEVTRRVREPLATVTGVGIARPEQYIRSGGVEPGMDILVSKWVGIEGTAILAREKEAELVSRFAHPFIDRAKEFSGYLSVCPEAAVAAETGVSAMHDASGGGIFGALWELAQSSGVGLEIDLMKIPVRQETVEICEFFDINPYKLMSGGCLLMAAKDGNRIVREMEKAGIHAVVIGKAAAGNDRVLFNKEERRFLEMAQTDELYKVIDQEGAGYEGKDINVY